MNVPGQRPQRRTQNRYQDMMRDVNFSQFAADPERDAANAKSANDAAFWGDAANIGLSTLGTVAGGAIGGIATGGAGIVPGAMLGGALGTGAGALAKNAITNQSNNQLTEDELRARKEAALMNAISMMR